MYEKLTTKLHLTIHILVVELIETFSCSMIELYFGEKQSLSVGGRCLPVHHSVVMVLPELVPPLSTFTNSKLEEHPPVRSKLLLLLETRRWIEEQQSNVCSSTSTSTSSNKKKTAVLRDKKKRLVLLILSYLNLLGSYYWPVLKNLSNEKTLAITESR